MIYRSNRHQPAFTLIELLVVVAIIALLISILMPSLAGARRLARTVSCATNIRGISQTMNVYAGEWNGAILGSGFTSNSGLLADPNASAPVLAPGVSDTNVPAGIIQPLDWMSGTARMMGVPFDQGTDLASRANRFNQLAGGYSSKTQMDNAVVKNFRCPENDIKATAFPDSTYGNPHPMLSYNTALGFQYRYGSGNAQYVTSYIGIPGSFTNKIGQVGIPSGKIFIAEGGRWWNGSGGVTTTVTITTTSPGGEGADYGPWEGPNFARSYCYISKVADGRGNAMRHGNRAKGTPYAAMKMNAAFFDGHAETMNGFDAANPNLWVPAGTTIDPVEAHPSGTPGFNEITKKYWPASGTGILATQ
ncbi:MAG: type II secretion system protein [Phycisphaerae bacterium]